MTEIILKNISYTYTNQEILKNINMQVHSGEIVSILGPSGVGKTTLFNLIAGILDIQSGKILLNGQEELRGQVSYMLQKDLLLAHKTALENVMMPLIIKKIPKKEAIHRAEKLLRTFQLEGIRDKYPHELSGGMRQRVALLRTYMFGHNLFLLDEAFSALDEMTKMELHKWYLSIHEQLELTTLIITHSIEEALALSNRIYILKNKPGQLVAEIKLEWNEEKEKELQKLAYKQQILQILGL
ncbi:MAG: ABC transporter ATP-binding protein [Streptococcus sp.]|nr:ABC transporter ATP-binding protein [Streptococcus sp.]